MSLPVNAEPGRRLMLSQVVREKLENGKSTCFIVLQLISNLTSARVNEIQALAAYNIAIAQLALDEGSTLDVNHIKLDVN